VKEANGQIESLEESMDVVDRRTSFFEENKHVMEYTFNLPSISFER
jgi:hypothetical protein